MQTSSLKALKNYFRQLPAYNRSHDECIEFLLVRLTTQKQLPKGAILDDVNENERDFFFLVQGYLKEMYRNPYEQKDELFNFIPTGSIFVNENSHFANSQPPHYYVAHSRVTYIQIPRSVYSEMLEAYPRFNELYLNATAEIQRNRRERLGMLRMSKTLDRIEWVKSHRPDIYKELDKTTLAQYIGVSRASLYRAFGNVS